MLNDYNKVELTGEIMAAFSYSHEAYGKRFYRTEMSIPRLSGVCDTVPIIVSDRKVDISFDIAGKWAHVCGQLRSNTRCGMLLPFVYAGEFECACLDKPLNDVFMDGYLCRKPNYRKTPRGREISDFLVSVKRNAVKSDYVPCIAWGEDAKFLQGFRVGQHMQIKGRMQSRTYKKRISETGYAERLIYEVSASSVEMVEEMP